MTQPPLSLLLRIGDETGVLPPSERAGWWSNELAEGIARCAERGRLIGVWRATWSSDWHYFAAFEMPDVAALEAGVGALSEHGVFRNARTSRLIGQRWGGEPGWDADKWKPSDRRADLGFVLFYRISESLYTMTDEQMTARHGQRRRRLDAAIADLIGAGGQRLGSYFCEWSSEWHLYVLYEAPDLETIATFNRALPERHGYIDYDLLFLVGRRLSGPEAITRP